MEIRKSKSCWADGLGPYDKIKRGWVYDITYNAVFFVLHLGGYGLDVEVEKKILYHSLNYKLNINNFVMFFYKNALWSWTTLTECLEQDWW